MRRRVNRGARGRRALAFCRAAHAGPVAGRDPPLAQARAHGDGLARGRPHDRGHPGAVHPGAGARVGAPDARPARGAGAAAPAVGRRAGVAGRRTCPPGTSAAVRVPTSVRWSTNQGRRWGSCTPSDGTIRISDRVRGMPRWVLDYVLLHELAHLLHAGHGPEFWAELDAYPRTLRARGFLEGYAYAAERGAPAGRRPGPTTTSARGRGRRRRDRGAGRRRGRRGGRRRLPARRRHRRRPSVSSSWSSTTWGPSATAEARRGTERRVERAPTPGPDGTVPVDQAVGSASGSSPRISASARSTSAASSTAVAAAGRVAGRVVEVLGAGQQVGVVPDGVARRRRRCRGRSAPTAPRRRGAGGAAARGRRGWRTSARPARRRRGGGGSSRAAPSCAAGGGARRWPRPRRPSPRPVPARSPAVRARPSAPGVVCGAKTPPDSACWSAAVSVRSIERDGLLELVGVDGDAARVGLDGRRAGARAATARA